MKNITLMAFAKGEESKTAGVIEKYIGVASVNVLGVCPNKAELEAAFGTTLENEPSYIGTSESNGKQVQYARVDILMRTDSEDSVECVTRMPLFVRKAYRYNRDNTKVQVIDKYGRTSWVTEEQMKTHAIPVDRKGNPLQISADYRPCYVGEEALTNFFKAFLNIPNCMTYKDGTWVMADNLDVCEARFDNIENLFKGDFTELVNAWKYQQNNKVKVLMGVRTNSDGRQYQDFYTGMFLKNGVSSYDRLEAAVKQTQSAGGYSSSTFLVNDCITTLAEYNPESTNLDESKSQGSDPFGDPNTNPFFQGNN